MPASPLPAGITSPPAIPFTLVPELEKYVHVSGSEIVWRFHGHDKTNDKPYGPIYFSDKERSRWDFPSTGGVVLSAGTWCAGKSFTGSLLEYFSKGWPSVLEDKKTKTSLLASRRVITYYEHTHVYVTRVQIPEGLRLFDLTKVGAFASIGYGLDAWVTSTKEYQYTRPWAQWFFQCTDIDGLVYSSRPGGADARNYVLFNRTGLDAKLVEGIGPTRRLGEWANQFKKAQEELNVIALSAPTPADPI